MNRLKSFPWIQICFSVLLLTAPGNWAHAEGWEEHFNSEAIKQIRDRFSGYFGYEKRLNEVIESYRALRQEFPSGEKWNEKDAQVILHLYGYSFSYADPNSRTWLAKAISEFKFSNYDPFRETLSTILSYPCYDSRSHPGAASMAQCPNDFATAYQAKTGKALNGNRIHEMIVDYPILVRSFFCSCTSDDVINRQNFELIFAHVSPDAHPANSGERERVTPGGPRLSPGNPNFHAQSETAQENYERYLHNMIDLTSENIRTRNWGLLPTLASLAENRSQFAMSQAQADGRFSEDIQHFGMIRTEALHTPMDGRYEVLWKRRPPSQEKGIYVFNTVYQGKDHTKYNLTHLNSFALLRQISMTHTDAITARKLVQKEAAPLFDSIIHRRYEHSKDLYEDLGRLHWLLSQATLYNRGSASISEQLIRSILKLKGYPNYPLAEGVIPDLEAFVTPEIEEYSKKYMTFYQLPSSDLPHNRCAPAVPEVALEFKQLEKEIEKILKKSQ